MIEYIICKNKIRHIVEVIVDDKQGFGTEAKEKKK